MATDKKPILDLDTLDERAIVRIGGKDYELRGAGEFSILESHKISKRAATLGAKLNGPDLSDEDVTAAEEVLGSLCQMILLAPAEVVASLTDAKKLRILSAFQQLPGPLLPTPTPAAASPIAEPDPQEAPIGAK